MGTTSMSVMPDGEPAHGARAAPRRGRAVSDDEVRVGVLVRTIEHEIIPRLMLAHRSDPACLEFPEVADGVSAVDVEMFVKLVLDPDEDLAWSCVVALRQKGMGAEDICLRLLAPVARRLGELWEQDLCDFTEVTFGLGRLQHILRDLGPAFEQAADAPANGYRVLLLPAGSEQHTFGLVMVAEFFRREGWDVEVALSDGGTDPVARVRADWFDVVGFSVSGNTHVEGLRQQIAATRSASQNPRLGIMLGGSLVHRDPGLAPQVGADMVAGDGRAAPALAEGLVVSRDGRRRR